MLPLYESKTRVHRDGSATNADGLKLYIVESYTELIFCGHVQNDIAVLS